jgi:Fic family protein
LQVCSKSEHNLEEMKRPATPPTVEELKQTIRLSEPILAAGHQVGGLQTGQEYRHWDTLRHHRPFPTGIRSSEELWFGVCFARLLVSQPLPLRGTNGETSRFSRAAAIEAACHRIDRHAGFQAAASVVSGMSSKYVIRTLFEESLESSILEGAVSTRVRAKELVTAQSRPRNTSEKMILNNFLAMQEIVAWKDQPITFERICSLQAIITEGTLEDDIRPGSIQVPGEQRVFVWDSGDGTMLHQPPPAEELPRRLDGLVAFANGQDRSGLIGFIHPILRAIICHFWLAYDHPFADGNGRTARALFYWLMLKNEYSLFEYLTISRVIRQARSKYERAFLFCETDGLDLTYFILHQLDVIEKAIRELNIHIETKKSEVRSTENLLLPGGPFNHRQAGVLRKALHHPDTRFTIAEHQASWQVSNPTARTDLLGLLDLGLFRQIGKQRQLVFGSVPALNERIENIRSSAEN